MFHYNAAPGGSSALRDGHYPSPQVPRHFDYNYKRLRANSFQPFELQGLSQYDWNPPPFIPTPAPPPRPPMTKGRKRHNNEYSPHVVKRQRIDSSPHPQVVSPLSWTPPLPHRPNKAVAESSGSSVVDLDHSFPSPRFQCPSRVLVVPESPYRLQDFAKDRLSSQMVELFEACHQQPVDLERKEMCRARLQQDIQRVYAEGRLYLTGSSMNELGCRTSDADLCLVIEGKKKLDSISVLSRLKNVFKSLSYVDRIQLIRAKVPILRFREKGSELEFDLNFNNTVGIRNTFLLRSYAFADLRIRPMILVVKKWARHHQINDASKGTLSSYTLVLMVVHYLQTREQPVLPSLQKDFPEYFSPFIEIDMVPEGPKNIPPYISRNLSSLGELLLGFLKYYAVEFRWDKQVISVREAEALPKTSSNEWRNKFICVEEPFEGNNVARAVHEKIKFNTIKAQFAQSWRLLKIRMNLNSILPIRAIINKELSGR